VDAGAGSPAEAGAAVDGGPPSGGDASGQVPDAAEGDAIAPPDAGEDAPVSGDDAGMVEDGGALGCSPEPAFDHRCDHARPHMVRCTTPHEPPSGCRLHATGNVIDWYCCP